MYAALSFSAGKESARVLFYFYLLNRKKPLSSFMCGIFFYFFFQKKIFSGCKLKCKDTVIKNISNAYRKDKESLTSN